MKAQRGLLAVKPRSVGTKPAICPIVPISQLTSQTASNAIKFYIFLMAGFFLALVILSTTISRFELLQSDKVRV
jgi:hypothetical protein